MHRTASYDALSVKIRLTVSPVPCPTCMRSEELKVWNKKLSCC